MVRWRLSVSKTRPITLLLGQTGCCSGLKPIIAVPGPTVVYRTSLNIHKESTGADTQCQCLTEILYDVHHDNLTLHELFIHYLRSNPETIPMQRTWKNQHCSCYNLSVLFESLGDSPPECQVLQNESKGVPRVNTLASMGHTGHQYQPFL